MKEFYDSITFADKAWLWALLALPLLLAYEYFFKAKRNPVFTLSNLKAIRNTTSQFKIWALRTMPVLRVLSLACLIIALARPQTSFSNEQITTEGIDIIMAMDVSLSMLAEDMHPNRIEKSKEEALNFIRSRPDDRIGLVIFAGESFTLCPATTDHTVLINQMKSIKCGDNNLSDGTAIGMGLGTAVDRLHESDSKGKVIILMTDGANNTGDIDPYTAADLAKKYHIRVYTIGLGNNGQAQIHLPDGRTALIQADIDEPLLKTIATKTDGKFFRADNDSKLKNIYKEIDQLEKTKIQVNAFHHKGEKFYLFAALAGAFLLLEIVLRYGVVRAIP